LFLSGFSVGRRGDARDFLQLAARLVANFIRADYQLTLDIHRTPSVWRTNPISKGSVPM
jgi:hypothetical protein